MRKRHAPFLDVRFPVISDHASEVAVLYVIAFGVILLIWRAIEKGALDGLDVAAFLLVLQRVIEAVTARWSQRSIDRMAAQSSNGAANPPAGSEGGTS